jgi:DNA-binding MarR family transcriptional regulator
MVHDLERRFEIAREIFRLNQIQQRRSRFIGTAYRSELTLLETYSLMELARDPSLSIAQLVVLLISERSAVTRAVAKLVRNHYIRKLPGQGDRRTARFTLLQRGVEFLAAVDRENREFTDMFLPHLDTSEIGVMKLAQRLLCEVVSAPPVFLRPNEHPFEEGIRRVTRAMGFIGPSLCGSRYSSTVWQLLSAVQEFSGSISISELSEMLSMHLATVSQTIARYQRRGWVQRGVCSTDARRRVLTIKRKGAEVVKHINQAGAEYIVKAFESQPVEVMQEFLRVFTKHLSPPRYIELTTLRAALSLVEALDSSIRDRARGFIITHRYRLGWLTNVPASLVSTENRTFVVLEEGQIVAVVECREQEGSFEVLHLCYNEIFNAGEMLATCLDRIMQIVNPSKRDCALTMERRFLTGIPTPALVVEDLSPTSCRVIRKDGASGF